MGISLKETTVLRTLPSGWLTTPRAQLAAFSSSMDFLPTKVQLLSVVERVLPRLQPIDAFHRAQVVPTKYPQTKN